MSCGRSLDSWILTKIKVDSEIVLIGSQIAHSPGCQHSLTTASRSVDTHELIGPSPKLIESLLEPQASSFADSGSLWLSDTKGEPQSEFAVGSWPLP